MLVQSLNSEFPKPNEESWEKKYIYAYSTSDVFTRLINTIQNLGTIEEFDRKMAKFMESAIDEA